MIEQREASEIVAPNSATNPWKIPVGTPVIFGNGKAYFIVEASPADQVKPLIQKMDEVNTAIARADSGEGASSEFFKVLFEFATIALSLQYNEDTVNELLDGVALTVTTCREIVQAFSGTLEYKVQCSKKA